MILINVKFPVRPERVDEWIAVAKQYQKDVSAEEGNVFFEWSRGLDDPNVFVAVECFTDMDAGARHMATAHVASFLEIAPDLVAEAPQIIFVDSPAISGWGVMGEITPR